VIRRVLAAIALLLVLVAPTAHAQDANGYSGGWTDPAASGERDGKPLAYLDSARPLTGQVSHPNGITRVSAVLVPDPDNPPADGCDASMDPNVAAEQNGTEVVFHVAATFPCNLVYEVRATAQANRGSGVGASTPPPYQMPLELAVAIPPAPVSSVEAKLTVDGDDRSVTLSWPANTEPDLLGYVITRVAGGDTDTLGQVDAGEDTTFVDDSPPAGKTSRYEVTAVRRGPDSDVKQVPGPTTAVKVAVPAKDASADGGTSGSTGGSGDEGLITQETAPPAKGQPNPNLLSQVRAKDGSKRPSLGPPTTLDSGFTETLPFGPGSPEAVGAPQGRDNAAIVFEEGDDASPFSNKPTMTFIAGGLAVLVGAAVIFYVTRRAARDAY
jgi:hypothetical protein